MTYVPMTGGLLLVGAMLCSTLAAQARIGVPRAFGSQDAISFGDFAGFDARRRQQVLLDERALAPVKGRDITALWVRRDHLLGLPLRASRSRLTLKMSAGRRPPSDPSPSFAANRGRSPVTVFSGVVQLPASGPVTKTIPWDGKHAVRIAFQRAYRYAGGTLCLEIEGEPLAPGAEWPVDWVNDAVHGTVTHFGTPCGLPAQRFQSVAGLWNRFTVPGGTMPVSAMGRAGTPALLVLASRKLQAPIDLTPLGATGCRVYLPADLVLAAVYRLPDTVRALAKARIDLHLPATPSMLRARLYAQWANLETGPRRSNPLGVTTTEALRIDLAGAMPAARISTVLSDQVPPSAPFPASGRVEVARGPVLRLELR